MCIADRVPFDAAMANDLADEYTDRYGGYVVDPNYVPVADRNPNMDAIRRCLTTFLANRAAKLGLHEPRLDEHDLRADAVEHGVPVGQMERGGNRQQSDEEGLENEDHLEALGLEGEYADGGYCAQFYF